MTESSSAIRSLDHAISPMFRSSNRKLVAQSKLIPRPSEGRLQQSLTDQPVPFSQLLTDEYKDKTYLYLAYGSNLCALTFLQRRGIRPLAQLNVVVPSIRLTFDLPGIPYVEPCFGNVDYRTEESGDGGAVKEQDDVHKADDFHKDRWHKGLVGVVYEVTASDYAHIIATEGGGAAYHDVLVDCYALVSDPSVSVPLHPTGTPVRAHTLFSPGRTIRPVQSYAQPSARYLKLITDGADEHDLPTEYKTYLAGIRPYQASTATQQLGLWLFLTIWAPILAFWRLGGGQVFLRPDGTYPPWYAKMSTAIFTGLWASYDGWFKPTFGDGERTIADGGSGTERTEKALETVERERRFDEKTPLLGKVRQSPPWFEPGTGGGDEMV